MTKEKRSYETVDAIGKFDNSALEHVNMPRFLRNISKSETSTCWIWNGTRTREGYGRFGVSIPGVVNTQVMAHRISYLLAYGVIPDGLVIDHKCYNTSCVNPVHLEAVTSYENTIVRGRRNFGYVNSKKTHCPNGHPYAENTGMPHRNGSRICIICRRATVARYQAKKRGLA